MSARRRLAVLAVLSLALVRLPSRAAESGAASPASPFANVAATLTRKAQASDRAYEIVRSLTVEVGPRSAGSAGDARAVQWAVKTMNTLGFENVHTEPAMVPHWERGENRGEVVSPYPQRVVLTALGGSTATPAEGITAPVLRVESLEALKALPANAAQGKIVFIDGRMQRTRDEVGYRDAVAKRGLGPSEAARKGAVAVLIRSAGTSPHRIAHTGGTRYADDVAKIPCAALSNPDADLLASLTAGSEPVVFHLQLLTQTLPDQPSANVIGELRGREKPEEIVLLGAHLDSWDLGMGALDDGAGCAIVLGATKLIAELPAHPRRTIRVVLFANEEFGLSGAQAYAAAHAAELPRHVAAIEADLGAGMVWRFDSNVDEKDLPRVAELAQLLQPLGIERGNNEAHGGADLIPIQPARVPLFGLFQDAAPYFDVHHTASDTLEMVDPAGLKQNVASHAILGYVLAEMPEAFGRRPEPKAAH